MATDVVLGRPEVGGFDEPMQMKVESKPIAGTLIKVSLVVQKTAL
jgi:hypothetical protein